MLAAVVASLALVAPAEPVCHGQLAPLTPEQEQQLDIEYASEDRADHGLPSDEAYVRELQRRGAPESEIIVGPVTPAEERYLRLRERLRLGPRAERYLARRRDVWGGTSIQDDWPRKPLLVVHLTRDRAVHEERLKALVRSPELLRTAQVTYPWRRLDRLADRINERDSRALLRAGFDVVFAQVVVPANRVLVTVVTPRTDHAEYFAQRYGPVVTNVKATEFTKLVCVEAGYFEVAPDGLSLIVHWIPQDTYAKQELIEVTESGDRVELGVVERHPSARSTDGAGPSHFKRRVSLSRALGDRAVIDAGDRAPLRQVGAGPGDPPCPPEDLDDEIARRTWLGLPTGREHVRRLLGRDRPFTRAEIRWLDQFDRLQLDPDVQRYISRHSADYAGVEVRGRFPRAPHLVVWFTRRVRVHQENLGPRVRVRRSPLSSEELGELALRIEEDAEDAGSIFDGYGDTGFYFRDSWTHGARVLVWLRTQRPDAAAYFRARYGPAVRVMVISRRWECAAARF